MNSLILRQQKTLTDQQASDALEALRRHAVDNGAPPYAEEPVAWVLEGEGQTVAALDGKIFWDWMYIDTLYVVPAQRRAGLGRQLMAAAEHEARRRGLKGMYLWTQSWEAQDFYLGCGFQHFVTMDDFPPGHQRHGLLKRL